MILSYINIQFSQSVFIAFELKIVLTTHEKDKYCFNLWGSVEVTHLHILNNIVRLRKYQKSMLNDERHIKMSVSQGSEKWLSG